MSISATINLTGCPNEPSVRVLKLDDGRRFLSLAFGPHASVILNGFDADAATAARDVIDALIEAVTALEHQEPTLDDEPCLSDGTPIYPKRKLTRQEQLEGLADRGVDTHEEFRSER